ncbi:MAG: phosphoribosylamine--glycine ligase [Elusimicrobia bacterium]|nr:phosphoribosylamine--glycine ligase [Elusimicrobiota bacterium]
MKVLLLGSGGREHAIAWKLCQSRKLKKLCAAPGSSAMAELAECVPMDILEPKTVANFAKKEGVNLVVIGPEGPLEAGVSDALRETGIPVFGPSREAARLETSKAFAKEFMSRHCVPTARWQTFRDSGQARQALQQWNFPVAVKADGLAAGKGVRVCASAQEALEAVKDFMEAKALGRAGETVLIEEGLSGPEVSVMALVDGKTWRLLPHARDHKRLLDMDQGPNTGGMGAYAPASLPPQILGAIEAQILNPVMAGLAVEKLDFRGVLYVGVMLTANGPKVLEFNARLGDPETQALLPLLDCDFLELAQACAEQRLDGLEVKSLPKACVCLTLTSEGYPQRPITGRLISGLEAAAKTSSDVLLFHAGTARKDGGWYTSGGRVLSVAALGQNLSQAREKAYAAAGHIKFQGLHLRRDIAAKDLA